MRDNGKTRVIHFTIANTGGGITKFVLRLWEYINKDEFEFDFVTMSPRLDFAEKLEKEGCNIFYLTAYAEDDKALFIKEVKEILARGYDVIHLHTNWWRGFVLEEIAKEMEIPKIVVHCHNTDVHIKEGQSREDARELHFRQRELLTEDKATDFWADSWKAAEWLYADRIPRERVKIIPCATELERFEYDVEVREKYRKELGLKDEYLIGHVGRFAYQKNHDFLIEIFADVAEQNPKARLLLVGIGELQKIIEKKVEELGLKEKVFFTGLRQDFDGLMQAMDLFAFPSRFEGLGIVLIEAQAVGLKCLTSSEIPDEVMLTRNIKRLPFDKKIWVKEILTCENYVRGKDELHLIRKAGYDIKEMVKDMEKMYTENR